MFKKLNYKHNLNLSKFLKQNDLGTIPKIFISSLGVILFFYIMPNFIFFFQNESLEFKNNSKALLIVSGFLKGLVGRIILKNS